VSRATPRSRRHSHSRDRASGANPSRREPRERVRKSLPMRSPQYLVADYRRGTVNRSPRGAIRGGFAVSPQVSGRFARGVSCDGAFTERTALGPIGQQPPRVALSITGWKAPEERRKLLPWDGANRCVGRVIASVDGWPSQRNYSTSGFERPLLRPLVGAIATSHFSIFALNVRAGMPSNSAALAPLPPTACAATSRRRSHSFTATAA
jgi:hypothetical protein